MKVTKMAKASRIPIRDGVFDTFVSSSLRNLLGRPVSFNTNPSLQVREGPGGLSRHIYHAVKSKPQVLVDTVNLLTHRSRNTGSSNPREQWVCSNASRNLRHDQSLRTAATVTSGLKSRFG